MYSLKPINGCVLVELGNDLEYVDTPDKQYATKTRGVVIDVSSNTTTSKNLIGKTVYFEDFKDGTQVEVDGKKFAFIKFKEIRGYSE
jgi:co-chaperonin GroES (HSP10)